MQADEEVMLPEATVAPTKAAATEAETTTAVGTEAATKRSLVSSKGVLADAPTEGEEAPLAAAEP